MEALEVGYRHSARFIRPFVKVLRKYDSVPREGLDKVDAVDLDTWVPYSVSAQFCDWGITTSQDADLGLHAAEQVEDGDFDVVEYAARSSDNIGTAVEVVNRYIGLLREGAQFVLESHGNVCRWNLDMAVPMPRAFNDWTVAVYVVMARRLSNMDLRPIEVHVTHAEPYDTTEYQRIIRAPVRFRQQHNALVFPREWLDVPVVEADGRLNTLMRRYAGELLERKPKTQSFRQRVRAAMAESLRRGQPCTARVARRLHVSERTLRRKLQDQGTNYKTLLEDVRRDMAVNYLQHDEDLGIAEIAFMLGFSHTPAFSRAFKRWTGATPVEYRESLRLRRVS